MEGRWDFPLFLEQYAASDLQVRFLNPIRGGIRFGASPQLFLKMASQLWKPNLLSVPLSPLAQQRRRNPSKN